MQQKEKLVPFGILDVVSGLLSVMVGTSRDTSDFIVDSLQQWWDENEDRYSQPKVVCPERRACSSTPNVRTSL